MTDLIKDVQKQDPGSRLIVLFELELDTDISTNSYVYFHSGLEGDLTTIQFRKATANSKTQKYDAVEYKAIPIDATGFEVGSGPSARPTLSMANVLTNFSDALEGLTNEDLLGNKVIRRKTLYKYCVGQSGDSGEYSAPLEFPKDIYFIDRIALESPILVSFELVSAYDLESVKLPKRNIVGNACPWRYQGADDDLAAEDRVGGCTWSRFSRAGDKTNFVNEEDEPVIPITSAPTSNYVSNDAITANYIYRQPKTGLYRIEPDGVILINDDTNNPVYDYWQATKAESNPGAPSDTNTFFRRVRVYKEYNIGEKWINAYTDISYNDYVVYTIGLDPNDKRTLEDYPKIFQVKNQTQVGGDYKPKDNGFPQFGNYWKTGDVCGKTMGSCTQRYQYSETNINASSDKGPNYNRNEAIQIQFGGFPTSRKYGR